MLQQHGSESPGRTGGDGGTALSGLRRPRTLLLGGLLLAVLIAGSAIVYYRFGMGPTTPVAASAPSGERTHPHPHDPSPEASASPSPLPATGPGTFVTAQATGEKVGRGTNPLRYMVQIENGIDLSPGRAAKEIADILADPRGWTRNGVSSFQLVSSGPYDLKVSIATAGTADDLCWKGIHQDTGGEYDCEVPNGVVVNLKRWVQGSPTFDGPIRDYRALIINHEMGHFLGHQHEACPGPGKPAPVMMQQIKGLQGCVANAWPYDKSGRYVSGPPAP